MKEPKTIAELDYFYHFLTKAGLPYGMTFVLYSSDLQQELNDQQFMWTEATVGRIDGPMYMKGGYRFIVRPDLPTVTRDSSKDYTDYTKGEAHKASVIYKGKDLDTSA